VNRIAIHSLALALVSTTACTASLDLERFKKEEAKATVNSASITNFDLTFTAKNMQSHIDEFMEVRLVDKSNNVQGKAVFADIPKPDFKIVFPKFIPKGGEPYRIDFWADHNKSNRYDGIVGGINEKDHAWRRVLRDPLPEDIRLVDGRYDFVFLHDTAFVDVFTDLDGNPISGADTLLTFKANILGGGAYFDKMVEIRVVDKGSGRLVALHRQGRARETWVAEVTGVLDEETPYEISIYVDANGDDEYSADDPSWRTEALSSELGIATNIDLATLPRTPLTEASNE
jgi:hypothetical protein